MGWSQDVRALVPVRAPLPRIQKGPYLWPLQQTPRAPAPGSIWEVSSGATPLPRGTPRLRWTERWVASLQPVQPPGLLWALWTWGRPGARGGGSWQRRRLPLGGPVGPIASHSAAGRWDGETAGPSLITKWGEGGVSRCGISPERRVCCPSRGRPSPPHPGRCSTGLPARVPAEPPAGAEAWALGGSRLETGRPCGASEGGRGAGGGGGGPAPTALLTHTHI